MNGPALKLLILAAVVTAMLSFGASAQETRVTSYTQEQLDQMLAPLALYPDPLVGQVLMAATYPLEIVEAARWLQKPDNAALRGDQLAAALESKPWDPSIKSLVAVPSVLQMMNKNLEWAEQLGDAFIGQQADVTTAIQRLRARAMETNALQSTAQQTVTTQDGAILIEPANPDVVYVPAYDPDVVYGAWPYPDYPPYDFYPPDYVFGSALLDFGAGIFIVGDFWGWDHWDWRHHRIDIDDRRFAALNGGHPPVRSGVWEHDPAHRHNVPYYNAGIQRQVSGTQVVQPAAQRAFRGFGVSSAATPALQQRTVYSPPAASVNAPVAASRLQVSPAAPAPERMSSRVAMPQMQRPVVPLFESHPYGAEARVQAARGMASRAQIAMPAMNRGGGEHRGANPGERR